jgi:hypothetical protein
MTTRYPAEAAEAATGEALGGLREGEPELRYASFETTVENVREVLERDGVCVIPNVITGEELEAMRDGMWDTLGHLTQNLDTPVSRDPSTWHAFQQLKPLRHTMLHDFGIGQAQVCWDVRQNPRVAEVFARVWGVPVEKLLTSTDGMTVHFPDELIPPGARHPSALDEQGTAAVQKVAFYGGPATDWFHVDQDPAAVGLLCVQGLVTAWDVNDGDATLAVLRGSHHHLADYAREFELKMGKSSNGFHRIPDGPRRAFFDARGCERVSVRCPAGSLVLWDSRTTHCGSLPQRGRATPAIRFVVYVCMLPRPADERERKEVLDRKQQVLAQQGTTSHWPLGEKVFPRASTCTSTGKAIPSLPPPVLTPLGRILAGLDDPA